MSLFRQQYINYDSLVFHKMTMAFHTNLQWSTRMYTPSADQDYLPGNVNKFANEVSVSKLFMLLYFYTELTREEAPWVDSWLIGTSVLVGSVLRGRRKSLKEKLSTYFSNASAGTCSDYVWKVLLPWNADDLFKTLVLRMGIWTQICFVKLPTHAHARARTQTGLYTHKTYTQTRLNYWQ